MSQTKKRTPGSIAEMDLHLPGWSEKQRHNLFEGIKVHGMKKLKKLQRYIGTKTQEEVRIATELYKKEVKNRELSNDLERQIEEAGVTDEDYKTWLYFYMASQSHHGNHLPVEALEAFLEQAAPRLKRNQEITFPGWVSCEVKDLVAAMELSHLIPRIEDYIPTKSILEVSGAVDAYAIMSETRSNASAEGKRVPTFHELKPGYIYLQSLVITLSDEEKLMNFKVPPKADPEMAKAQFILKEWLMPDVGALEKGWTADEKYALYVAIEAYGMNDLRKIHSYLHWKSRTDLQMAIKAIQVENAQKEEKFERSVLNRFKSMTCWNEVLKVCKENKYKIAAGQRLICALEPMPRTPSALEIFRKFIKEGTIQEFSRAMIELFVYTAHNRASKLVPDLELIIAQAEEALCHEAAEEAAAALAMEEAAARA